MLIFSIFNFLGFAPKKMLCMNTFLSLQKDFIDNEPDLFVKRLACITGYVLL
jgi:hypothetical protein